MVSIPKKVPKGFWLVAFAFAIGFIVSKHYHKN
jgi:hypothetical protein